MKLVPAVQERLFNRLVVGFVVTGFAVLIATGVLGLYVLQRNVGFTARVAHTYDVRQALSDFRIAMERAETARRGYLLSRDQQFLTIYRQAVGAQTPILERLRALTVDNPAQQRRLDRLARLLDEQHVAGDRSIQEMRAGENLTTTAFALDPGVLRTRDIRDVTVAMDQAERALLESRNDQRLVSIRNMVIVMAAAGVVLLIVAIASILVILRFTRDLTESRDALRQMNASLEDTVRARTSDLQRANDEIQRFAYIVSHDLRSPLVNVMGFTSELETALPPLQAMLAAAEAEAGQVVTREAREAVERDMPEAIGFIRSSTQKMDRLINAILRLSREGRRVLAPEPLRMTALLEGVKDTFRARTDAIGARIEVAEGLPDVVSDRLALEQVFTNLVENALKYLKPGRPGRVRISGRLSGGRAVYEVADNGRGIDPKDHDRVFDLFRRSGVQDQPGEGIGLAHVRALTYRLGGTIECDSALDQGAIFRVSLPARLLAEGSAS